MRKCSAKIPKMMTMNMVSSLAMKRWKVTFRKRRTIYKEERWRIILLPKVMREVLKKLRGVKRGQRTTKMLKESHLSMQQKNRKQILN